MHFEIVKSIPYNFDHNNAFRIVERQKPFQLYCVRLRIERVPLNVKTLATAARTNLFDAANLI